MPQPELLSIRAADGYVCQAVLQVPEGQGPFPGVVAIHGGMGSQPAAALMAIATSENEAPRHLVRDGYAVLTSDYRHPSLVDLEIDDTVAAYETLCRHPAVLADRVALCGTSHGGVCALYAGLRIAPACIVAEEAATDLAYRHETLYANVREQRGELEGYLKLDKELWDEFTARMGGPPSLVPEAYERASGHAQAANVRSPVLLLSGDADYLPHSLTMAAALLKAKKDCTCAFYRNAWHTGALHFRRGTAQDVGGWWGGRCEVRGDSQLSRGGLTVFSFLPGGASRLTMTKICRDSTSHSTVSPLRSSRA